MESEKLSKLERENKELRETQEKLLKKIAELESSDIRLGTSENIHEPTPSDELRNTLRRINEWITGLLGYKIDFGKDTITLHSLYAFDEDDKFVFNRAGDVLELISNEFACEWSEEIHTYLVNGKSIPAFLSAVTLELFNQKTFG
ncbi:Mitotic spindle assembly checkpoint protein MAD1 [Astathelohania contejeani]|uniref:Spindle assembly checkpoint component MAD1 n=1 Tax=Astathelohania contejeani TaxID=164912 RepID=A0ABQ7HZ50_9MICR|nr:Mitotic spindle assembly checkpoint protein MAD1 [Thelohania contejeani]